MSLINGVTRSRSRSKCSKLDSVVQTNNAVNLPVLSSLDSTYYLNKAQHVESLYNQQISEDSGSESKQISMNGRMKKRNVKGQAKQQESDAILIEIRALRSDIVDIMNKIVAPLQIIADNFHNCTPIPPISITKAIRSI
jgi:hypothetical protein